MDQEKRSSTLPEEKVPVLQDISPLPLRVKDKKYHVSTRKEASTDKN